MFEPKKDHPRWFLWLYPYLFLLRHDRKTFFRVLTGRIGYHWHYSWESEPSPNDADDEDDGWYKPGSFILPDPGSKK